MKATQLIAFCILFNVCLGIHFLNVLFSDLLQNTAAVPMTPEEQFAQKCVARTGTAVVANSITYTIQKAYVWGTSCYVLTLEAAPTHTDGVVACLAIDPDMHPAFLQTPAEFAVVDSFANHVQMCAIYALNYFHCSQHRIRQAHETLIRAYFATTPHRQHVQQHS
jgi:hypothetical protein